MSFVVQEPENYPPSISRRPGLAVAAFVGLALLASAGYATWEYPAWVAARDTRRASSAGRHDEALTAAGRWIRIRPRAAEAHFLRARAGLALDRRRDLVDGLVQAQALGYPKDQIDLLQALVDAQAGRFELARPVLIRAFNEAGDPDLLVDEALARVLMELYDWPRAGAVLARWARDAPDDPRPPLWHATVHRRRNSDPEKILGHFREALRRDPDLSEARLGLAEELARAGRHREAEPEYEAYLARTPDDPVGHLGAGRNAVELGNLDAAVRRFDRALALDPENPEVHIEQARFARLRGDEAGALAHLDRAIAGRPHDLSPHYNRVIALGRLGRPDEARKEREVLDRLRADLDEMNGLRERLNTSPDDPNLQCRLAQWMFAHGYDPEGLKWSSKILADHPGHRETCALLARYYESKGNPELARSYRSRISPRTTR